MMAGLQTTALLVMVLGPALVALAWSLWLWLRYRAALRAHTKALQALQDQVAPLRALVDNLDDMAWIKDQRGRFVFVNRTFGDVFGLTPEQVVGKTDLDFSPPSVAAKYQADDQAVMRSRQPSRIEESVARPGGAVEWCETYKVPVLNHLGEAVGTAGMVRDVTRRRQAADAAAAAALGAATALATAAASASADARTDADQGRE
jgi:PAS domain S-box-containing protein